MRVSLILLSLLVMISGCTAPNLPPTDEEMIQHFYNKHLAFEEIYAIISLCPDNSYYPPYDVDDTICLKGIPSAIQAKLDSLLSEIRCERIFYGRQTCQKLVDTIVMEVSIPFFASGYSIGGLTKNFAYRAPIIRDYYKMTDSIELNEVYCKNYKDTILYKPIIGNWYINLIYDN